jgi:hypothetical protein
LLAKFETKNFVRLSSDGTKVLQESDGLYEILDINGNRVFELTVDYSKNYVMFSPNLQYCFLFYNNGDDGTIISTWDNTKCKAQVEYQPSFRFSDDGSSFGYIRYDESSGENSIIIHDSKSGQIIHNIPIEGNDSTTFLNQIHNNKKALYTYENDSYIIDFDGDNKTLLGHNIFFTQLSQDEKYLAYSKTYVLDLRFDISNPYIDTLESDDERGLYIKNMITGDTKFFPYTKSGNEVLQPVKWLSFSEE